MTQMQLAERAGFKGRANVAHIELGLVTVSLRHVQMLANGFHIRPAELLRGVL